MRIEKAENGYLLVWAENTPQEQVYVFGDKLALLEKIKSLINQL